MSTQGYTSGRSTEIKAASLAKWVLRGSLLLPSLYNMVALCKKNSTTQLLWKQATQKKLYQGHLKTLCLCPYFNNCKSDSIRCGHMGRIGQQWTYGGIFKWITPGFSDGRLLLQVIWSACYYRLFQSFQKVFFLSLLLFVKCGKSKTHFSTEQVPSSGTPDVKWMQFVRCPDRSSQFLTSSVRHVSPPCLSIMSWSRSELPAWL